MASLQPPGAAQQLVFSCTYCGKRMKTCPPAPTFNVTCVACRKPFTVHTAAFAGGGPGNTPAAAAAEEGDAEISEGVTPSDVFAEYRTSLKIAGALPHPADIVESQSLAATPVPPVAYRTVYEQRGGPLEAVLLQGKLSGLQLETVALCGARHARILPDGRRAGFFLGDGAGVGKGRQIAGVILDNIARGRRKHLWFSTSTDLRLDAERDFADLGAPGVAVHDGCQQLDRETRGLGLSSAFAEGVVFSTYSSLVSASRVGKGGISRLQQLVDWCGGERFDGCIVFDECHKAKNYKEGKEGKAGSADDGDDLAPASGAGRKGGGGGSGGGGSKVAACVLELQRRLPSARVLYASATGCSEPEHLAYMERLGQWGAATPFGADFGAFLDSLEQRGLGALELLALDMKAGGLYLARSLSYAGAEFEVAQIRLSAAQRECYDGVSRFWRRMQREIAAAKARLHERGGAAPPGGGGAGRGGGGSGVELRLFQQMAIASKVPQVVALARQALAAGRCVVIGLQTTGEAALHAELARGLQLSTLPSSVREMLRRHLAAAFPTEVDGSALAKRRDALAEACAQLVEQVLKARRAAAGYGGAGGGDEAAAAAAELIALQARHEALRLELDATHRQIAAAAAGPCAECVVAKARLEQELEALPLPPSALDWLVDELGGPLAVAEMTGRKGRMVRLAQRAGGAGGAGRDGPFGYAPRLPSDAAGYATQEAAAAAAMAGPGGGGGGLAGGSAAGGAPSLCAGVDETEQLNVLERKAFTDGRKLVAILSDAASTGISLHADRRCANQRRRVHITLELAWSADKAVQQLGRSHRSNQSSAPAYVLAQTELGGEARFASAVAKRLQNMGALTRGDRRAASGADLSQFNLDTVWGKRALTALLHSVAMGTMSADVDYARLAREHAQAESAALGYAVQPLRPTELHARLRGAVEAMGLLPEASDGHGAGAAGEAKAKGGASVKQFLNRLLTLQVSEQGLVFATFSATVDALIATAIKEGKYDSGVGDITATSIVKRDEQHVWTDPTTHAATRLVAVQIDRGVGWEAALAKYRATKEQPEGGAYGGEAGGAHGGEAAAAAGGAADSGRAADAGGADAGTAEEAAGEAEGADADDDAPSTERARRHDGFYRSNFKFQGKHTLFLLALSRHDEPRKMLLTRPNTGAGRSELERDELLAKYSRVRSLSEAAEGWRQLHALTASADSESNLTSRLCELAILSGTLTPLWSTLQSLVKEHSAHLTRAERQLKVVRIQTTDTAERIVGVRWPQRLHEPLAERLALLRAAKAGFAAGAPASAAFAGDPIDGRSVERALKPKPSIKAFFAPLPSTAAAGGAPASGAISAGGGGERLCARPGTGRGAVSAIDLDADEDAHPPARPSPPHAEWQPQRQEHCSSTPRIARTSDVVDLTSAEPTVRQANRTAGGADGKRPAGAGSASGDAAKKAKGKQPTGAQRTVAISHFFKKS